MPPRKAQPTTTRSVNAQDPTSSILKHHPNAQRHPTLQPPTQATTSPPSPPALEAILPIPYRQRPNINNTLLMSDPLYRPVNLSGASRPVPGNLQESDIDEDSEEEDENRIEDGFPSQDQSPHIPPGRQRHTSTNARNMGSHNMGMRESRGDRGETRACHPLTSRETKDPRRSGSPPSRLQEIYRRREDTHGTNPRRKLRSQTQSSERMLQGNEQSYPAKCEARAGNGARNESRARECSSPEDLMCEITRYWDVLDGQEEAVKTKIEGKSWKSSDLLTSLEEQCAGREAVDRVGEGAVENSEEDERPRRRQGKKVIKRGRDTFFA